MTKQLGVKTHSARRDKAPSFGHNPAGAFCGEKMIKDIEWAHAVAIAEDELRIFNDKVSRGREALAAICDSFIGLDYL